MTDNSVGENERMIEYAESKGRFDSGLNVDPFLVGTIPRKEPHIIMVEDKERALNHWSMPEPGVLMPGMTIYTLDW